MTYLEALRAAPGAELEARDDLFLIGEDIETYDGALKLTAELYERGEEELLDAPSDHPAAHQPSVDEEARRLLWIGRGEKQRDEPVVPETIGDPERERDRTRPLQERLDSALAMASGRKVKLVRFPNELERAR